MFETLSAEPVRPVSPTQRDIRDSVIRTILYFDIFHYPVKLEEIVSFLDRKASTSDAQEALSTLISKGVLFQFNEFYSAENNRENIVRRLKGNELASEMTSLAKRQANLIGKFPFVESVMASGSLSKGYMDETSDLDFFIVTAPGRLWIARTLLVLYKRIFLGNSHKHFCVNYFVSSDKLEIEEKNRFTATELATVMPLFNEKVYDDLLSNNEWVTRFLPNFVAREYSKKMRPLSRRRRMLEQCINLLGGNWIDDLCMTVTYKRWVRLYRADYSASDFEIAFKTKKYASKNHPRHYQRKIGDLLEQKWKDFSQRYNPHEL